MKTKKQNHGRLRLLLLLLPVCTMLFVSCGGKKNATKSLYSGDYDRSIRLAVEDLRKGKDQPKRQKMVVLLEEAYYKAVERDQRELHMLKSDRNPANFGAIYDVYMQLYRRQELIRPLLPLKITEERRQARFDMVDYTALMSEAKRSMSDYYYNYAVHLLEARNSSKMEYRKAHEDLAYVLQENPGFRNAKEVLNDLWLRGADFIHVYTRNDTRMVIPKQLEEDLLNFSTWGLDDKWTVFHNKKVKGVQYDHAILVSFRNILISPEQMAEKQFVAERDVEVGKRSRKDANGKEVKEAVYERVKANITEFRQFKTTEVQAKVDYLNIQTGQINESHPLSGSFTFENIYARCQGDERAVESKYRKYFRGRHVPYPSNERMIFDCAESLKANLKNILARNQRMNKKKGR